jgi:starvation-inducible DNA-binding protein
MLVEQIEAPSIQAPSGIDWDLRKKLVARLNQDLATLTDLTLAYKQAHWNVLGRGFGQLHLLFDRFAAETRAYVDDVAERALALGGVARGTIQDVAENSVLPAFPSEEREEGRLIDELARRVDATADEARFAIEATRQDPVTQDLYIDVVRGIEEQRWMLLAHLPRQHPNGVAHREAP